MLAADNLAHVQRVGAVAEHLARGDGAVGLGARLRRGLLLLLLLLLLLALLLALLLLLLPLLLLLLPLLLLPLLLLLLEPRVALASVLLLLLRRLLALLTTLAARFSTSVQHVRRICKHASMRKRCPQSVLALALGAIERKGKKRALVVLTGLAFAGCCPIGTVVVRVEATPRREGCQKEGQHVFLLRVDVFTIFGRPPMPAAAQRAPGSWTCPLSTEHPPSRLQ